MEFYFELFENLPRQGPGDIKTTQKVYSMIANQLPSRPRIADIGCGVGMQTIALASYAECEITAVDLHQPFLDKLDREKDNHNLKGTIETRRGSMFDLQFERESYDLFWAEGAIYLMGFGEALEEWRKFLKPSGFIVASDVVWLKDNPPEECRTFWEAEYPDMPNLDRRMKLVEEHGYTFIESVPLPTNSWWENYYHPLGKEIEVYRHKYGDDDDFKTFLNSLSSEINIFKKYSDYFGYQFFVMKLM